MNIQGIERVLKELQNILQGLPSDKKQVQLCRRGFFNLKTILEECRDSRQNKLASVDFQKIISDLKDSPMPKIVLQTFAVLQDLVSFKLIQNVTFYVLDYEEILDYLKTVKSIQEDDAYQFKLSQITNTLVTKELIDLQNIPYLEKCLHLLLFLKDNHNPIISYTAKTQLEQFFIISCTNYNARQLNQPNEETKNQNEKLIPLPKLLVDLIFVIDGQRPAWYPQNSIVEKELALKWLNTIITSVADLVFPYKEVVSILKFNLLPCCRKILKQYLPPVNPQLSNKDQFLLILVIEIFRCFTYLIEGMSEEFIDLFNIFAKYIQHPENSCCKTMSFECAIYFARNSWLLNNLLVSNELTEAKVVKIFYFIKKNQFIGLLSNISGAAKALEATQLEYDSVAGDHLMIGHLESDNINNQVILDNGQVIRMISDFQHVFVANLMAYLQQTLKQKNKIPAQLRDQYRQFIRVLEHTGRLSLQSLRSMLFKETNDVIMETCLQATSKYIALLGEVHNKQLQQDFITMLCSVSLPVKESNKITKYHLLAQKSILKILKNQGHLVDYNGWIKFLSTLNESEQFHAQNRLIRLGTQEEIQKIQLFQIISIGFDDIFKKSDQYNVRVILSISKQDSLFIMMLDALNSVTINEMSVSAAGQQKVTSVLYSHIKETVQTNLFRLDLFWELVTAHFTTLSNSKYLQLRENGAITLSQFIINAFQYMAKYYKLQPLEQVQLERLRTAKHHLDHTSNSAKDQSYGNYQKPKKLVELKDDQYQQKKENQKGEKLNEYSQIDGEKLENIKQNKDGNEQFLQKKLVKVPQVVKLEQVDFNIDFDKELPDDFYDEFDSPFGIQQKSQNIEESEKTNIQDSLQMLQKNDDQLLNQLDEQFIQPVDVNPVDENPVDEKPVDVNPVDENQKEVLQDENYGSTEVDQNVIEHDKQEQVESSEIPLAEREDQSDMQFESKNTQVQDSQLVQKNVDQIQGEQLNNDEMSLYNKELVQDEKNVDIPNGEHDQQNQEDSSKTNLDDPQIKNNSLEEKIEDENIYDNQIVCQPENNINLEQSKIDQNQNQHSVINQASLNLEKNQQTQIKDAQMEGEFLQETQLDLQMNDNTQVDKNTNVEQASQFEEQKVVQAQEAVLEGQLVLKENNNASADEEQKQQTEELTEQYKLQESQVLELKDSQLESVNSSIKDQEQEDQKFEYQFRKFQQQPDEFTPGIKMFEKAKWKEEKWQATIFEPWVQLLNIKYRETRQIVVDHVETLLQSSGHQISKGGWEIILKILYEVSQDQEKEIAVKGFKGIQHLINWYLTMIDQKRIPQIFEIIENFRKNSNDQSVNFEFCEMLWHFGDYVTKMQIDSNEDIKRDYMNKIFMQLTQYSLDSSKDIRNSALHIMCNLLLHNSAALGIKFWKDIFDNHFYPTMKTIINTQYEKLKGEASDAQQWQITCKNLIRASNKVFKRYFQLLDENLPNYDISDIEKFGGDIAEESQFRKLVEIQYVLQMHLKQMATLLNQLQAQMHSEIIEAIKEIFIIKPYEHQLLQSTFLDTLQYIKMIFTIVPQSLGYAKHILQNVTQEVLNLIILQFKNFYPLKSINQKKYIEELCQLYIKVVQYPQLVQQTHSSLKTTSDQLMYIKPFEILLQLASTYPNLDDLVSTLLIHTFQFSPLDVFNDYFIRKIITQTVQFVLQKNNYKYELGLILLKGLSYLLEYRWQNKYHRWFFSIKKFQQPELQEKQIVNPIWLFAFEVLFEVSVQILLRPPYPYHQIFDILLQNHHFKTQEGIQRESFQILSAYLQDQNLRIFLTFERKTIQFLYKKFVNSPYAIIKVIQSYHHIEDGREKAVQMAKDFSWVLFQMSSPEHHFQPFFKEVTRKLGDEVKEENLNHPQAQKAEIIIQQSTDKFEYNLAIQAFRALIELTHYKESQKAKIIKKEELNENSIDKQGIWVSYLKERSRSALPFLLARVINIFRTYIKQLEDSLVRIVSDEFVVEMLDQLYQLRIPQYSFPLDLNMDQQLEDLFQLNEPNQQNFLNSDCGHLFYLFPLLIRALESSTNKNCKKEFIKIFDKIYSKFGFSKQQ